MAARLQTALSADAFLDYVAAQIVAKGWTLRESANGKRTFAKADQGQTWLTTVTSTRDGDTAALKETMTIRNLSSQR